MKLEFMNEEIFLLLFSQIWGSGGEVTANSFMYTIS
jgi:hypothetical protein